MALAGYTYRRTLTIDSTKISSGLTDFTDVVLLNAGNFDFSKAKSDGTDIVFTDTSDNILKFERYSYDFINEVADFYVKIPSVSVVSDTEYYMYYGNLSAADEEDANNAWNANEQGVWHMGTSLVDSTGNGNNGTATGTNVVDGEIAKGRDFTPTDYIDCGNDASLSFGTGSFSIRAFFKNRNVIAATQYVVANGESGAGGKRYAHRTGATSNNLEGVVDDDVTATQVNSTLILSTTQYNYASIIRNRTNDTLDAKLDNLTRQTIADNTNNSIDSTSPFLIGALDDGTTIVNGFDGIIDEVRVSSAELTDAWLDAEYESMNQTLTILGAEQQIIFPIDADVVAISILDTDIYMIVPISSDISSNALLNVDAILIQPISSNVLSEANLDIDMALGLFISADINADATLESKLLNCLGELADARTEFLKFGDNVYILDGTNYKQYDGTTLQDVEPYVPTVAIGSPPSGGGTSFEEINLLTGQKKQEFVGDTTALYQLAEVDIDSVNLVTVDGVTKVVTTDYTVDLTLGQVTFVSGNPGNDSEVIITWTKETVGNADLVKKNRSMLAYGVSNDTSIFMWGNPDKQNRRIWSATQKPNYFPVSNFTDVGTDEFAITDIAIQYDRQIIFKEDRTHYSKPEFVSLTSGYDFPVFDLNESVGNIAYRSVQLIENNPLSLKGQSMWRWSNTQVEDERNARIISDRIKLSLEELNLTEAITFDYQSLKEYWLNIGTDVWIWNYGNDTFYKYDNANAEQFVEIDSKLYFGSSDGKIKSLDNTKTNDDGTIILARWASGFTDFGALELRKSMRQQWVSISPASRTSVDVLFATDRKVEAEAKTSAISQKLFSYGNINYGSWTYKTNRNPQVKRIKNKVKKFVELQTILENNKSDETLTVLQLSLQAQTQGYSK